MKIKSLLVGGIFSCLVAFFSNANAYYSIEIQDAYYWALGKSITTIRPIDNADLDWYITRQQMAKMISNFAINVMKKDPDYSKPCRFMDNDISEWLLPYVITSCQLWLMWQWINKFNPRSVVTRAEFWTILSRVLWWDKYDKWKRYTYYEKHLKALQEAKIMKDNIPLQIEVRWFVFIMLMRAANMVQQEQAKNSVKTNTWFVITWAVQTWDVSTWTIATWSIAGSWLNLTWTNLSWSTLTWGNLTWENALTWDAQSVTWSQEAQKKSIYTYTTWEKVILNARSEKIYWVLYQPEREGKMPIIIFSHWLWSNYESWIPYAEALAQAWVAAYLFDFRWGWNDSKSDWLTTDMSVLTEESDLESVLNEVKKWDFVDKDKIVLWWASQWGLVTALVAARHSDIKWSILLFPAFSIPETVKSMFPNVEDIKDTYNVMWLLVGKRFAADIWDLDVYSEIAKDEKPVLILHWTSDPIVPISYSEKANKTYHNNSFQKIYWWVHWFTGRHFDTSLKHIKEFLKNIWIID